MVSASTKPYAGILTGKQHQGVRYSLMPNVALRILAQRLRKWRATDVAASPDSGRASRGDEGDNAPSESSVGSTDLLPTRGSNLTFGGSFGVGATGGRAYGLRTVRSGISLTEGDWGYVKVSKSPCLQVPLSPGLPYGFAAGAAKVGVLTGWRWRRRSSATAVTITTPMMISCT